MTDDKRRVGAPKKDPRNVRSERMSILLTPNTLEDLRTLVDMKNDTLNNMIHELIEEEVEKNREDLEKYREFMDNLGK